MREIIYTQNLCKNYKDFCAVDSVSLSVQQGEIYGFLGLNGAGKTTTIRMLLGMIRPTSGSCFINGYKVSAGNYNIWKDVGYMVEAPYSYPELSVKENLEMIKTLRQIDESQAVECVMDRLNLTPYKDRKAKHLSMGNAQRLGIAKALLHNPKVLILDEPTNGLDPAGIVEIRELIQELAYNQGTTIFISSHILDEISKIASKIGIIHEGVLLKEVRKEELEQQRMIKLVVNALDREGAARVLSDSGLNVYKNSQGVLEIFSKKAVRMPEQVARFMVEANHPPTMLQVVEEDLESYFLRVIGKKGGSQTDAIS